MYVAQRGELVHQKASNSHVDSLMYNLQTKQLGSIHTHLKCLQLL